MIPKLEVQSVPDALLQASQQLSSAAELLREIAWEMLAPCHCGEFSATAICGACGGRVPVYLLKGGTDGQK